MILNIFLSLRDNGTLLTFLQYWEKIANKLFNLMLKPGRFDLKIDRSARILGLSHIQMGKNFTAGKSLWLQAVLSYGKQNYAPKLVIKDNVSFSDRVHIGATYYVEIGNNVLMASDIYISDHNHGFYAGATKLQSSPQEPPVRRQVNDDKKTVIGDNVWIGERVCVLPGVHVGSGSVIGAGSIVTKDIPANSIAVGNPARVVKKYDFSKKKWLAKSSR